MAKITIPASGYYCNFIVKTLFYKCGDIAFLVYGREKK